MCTAGIWILRLDDPPPPNLSPIRHTSSMDYRLGEMHVSKPSLVTRSLSGSCDHTPSGSVSRQNWSAASRHMTCTFAALSARGSRQSRVSCICLIKALKLSEPIGTERRASAVAQQWKYSCELKQARVWFVIRYQCSSMSRPPHDSFRCIVLNVRFPWLYISSWVFVVFMSLIRICCPCSPAVFVSLSFPNVFDFWRGLQSCGRRCRNQWICCLLYSGSARDNLLWSVVL